VRPPLEINGENQERRGSYFVLNPGQLTSPTEISSVANIGYIDALPYTFAVPGSIYGFRIRFLLTFGSGAVGGSVYRSTT
jgi:hypothetical protein